MDRVTQQFASRHRAAAGFCIGLAMLTATPTFAADYFVTTTDDTNALGCSTESCSLREAILAANAGSGPSTIHLGVGNYGVRILGINEDAGVLGDLDIRSDVTIVGAGSAKTSIGTAQINEQVIDVAVGASLRMENLTVGAPVRAGSFSVAQSSGEVTRLSYVNTIVNVASYANRAITAYGSLEIIDSKVIVPAAPSYGPSILLIDGNELNIVRSTIETSRTGVKAMMASGGDVYMNNASVSGGGLPTDHCSSLDISGAEDVELVRVQVQTPTAPGQVTSCIRGTSIAISDSSFLRSHVGVPALMVSGVANIINSTVAGTLMTSGSVSLDSTTIGDVKGAETTAVTSIDNSGGAAVTISNSVVIGVCVGGGVTALGNNVESPGNTCGLPTASNLVAQNLTSLALADLAYNGGTTLNHLPGANNILTTVFTVDGLARCRSSDQRGYLRAAACTMGAVEAGAADRILLRHGFDSRAAE